MASVYWPSLLKGYNETTSKFQDYGFNLRTLLLEDVRSPTFGDNNGFKSIGAPFGFIVSDQYSGSFVIQGVTYKSGTITSIVREGTDRIDGLQLDFQEASAAASTPDKTDDVVLWAKAFAGDDVFFGSKAADVFEGFDGNDRVTGGLGSDKLYGGAGSDTFVFKSYKDSTVAKSGQDTIYDFSRSEKDKIDLRALDANTKKGGNQAFSFIGRKEFQDKAGELRIEKAKGGTLVSGDVNGDGKADFAILLKGVSTLAKGDFFL
jgi:Ca2+-binding RTX toxin-like protein